MPDGTAEIRKGRKFDQVLEGAREVFMAKGFEGASVDDIARSAGVSKATLYSYFPDKKMLFLEVATLECQRHAEMASPAETENMAPREFLACFGNQILALLLSKFGLATFRVCIAESDRFPELGQHFFQSGPMAVRDALAAYLRAATGRGDLVIDDYELAAEQFCEMCKVDLHPKMLLGLITEATPDQIDRVVTGAIDTFMARYGA